MRALIFALVAAVVVAGIAAYGVVKSRTRTRIMAIAGRYEFQFPPLNLPVPPRSILTLRADGRFSRVDSLMGTPLIVGVDSGTFTVDDATLLLTSEADAGPASYAVSGDSLFIRTSSKVEQTQQVTGVTMKGTEGVLVRTSRTY